MKGVPLSVFLHETYPGVVGKATTMSSTEGSFFKGEPGGYFVVKGLASVSVLTEPRPYCLKKKKKSLPYGLKKSSLCILISIAINKSS